VVAVTVFEAAAGGLFIPIEAGKRPGDSSRWPSSRLTPKGTSMSPTPGVGGGWPNALGSERQHRQRDQEPRRRSTSRCRIGQSEHFADSVVGEINVSGSSINITLPLGETPWRRRSRSLVGWRKRDPHGGRFLCAPIDRGPQHSWRPAPPSCKSLRLRQVKEMLLTHTPKNSPHKVR
jgi:hypothetical protein